MTQTLAEKKRLLKMGHFYAHLENGKIVTDQDEMSMHMGTFGKRNKK